MIRIALLLESGLGVQGGGWGGGLWAAGCTYRGSDSYPLTLTMTLPVPLFYPQIPSVNRPSSCCCECSSARRLGAVRRRGVLARFGSLVPGLWQAAGGPAAGDGRIPWCRSLRRLAVG